MKSTKIDLKKKSLQKFKNKKKTQWITIVIHGAMDVR